MLLLRRRPALHAARQLRQAHTELCRAVLRDECPGADGSGACPPSCEVDRLLRNGADANEGLPLQFAKSPCIVRRLLAADPPADVSARNSWGDTALHRNNTRLGAKTDADAPATRLLLDAGANPNATSTIGYTPLHRAATTEVVAMLLNAGADANAKTLLKDTPLHFAPSSAAVRLLLEAGADPNAAAGRSGNPPTPLECAAQRGCVESVRLLLGSGARLRSTALHFAAACCREDGDAAACVRELLAAGADANARNSHGRTPLHNAASGEAAALLLAAGADVHARNSDGETPLHTANGRADVLQELMQAGAGVDANARDACGRTPLMRGKTASAAALLLEAEAGARVDVADKQGDTALHHAARGSQAGFIEALLVAGADPNARNGKHETPLHHCTGASLEALLGAAGALVDARDAEGRTPLMYASASARDVGLLLAAGARVDVADNVGDTALHCAARACQTGAVEQMLAAGADPNAVGLGGRVPLHGGMEREGVVGALLAAGARPDHADDAGRTPLFGAIREGGARLLLEAGADPNAVSLQGETPLHALAGNRRTAAGAVRAVIKAGGDVNAVDSNGATPLHLAAPLFKPFPLWDALVDAGGDESAEDAEGRTPEDWWWDGLYASSVY